MDKEQHPQEVFFHFPLRIHFSGYGKEKKNSCKIGCIRERDTQYLKSHISHSKSIFTEL